MSFLQPLLLFALPLALLPVIIHLIHLHRRRTVQWAAMQFLLAAQQMNRGYSRLRRWLILAFRVIAVAAILLTAARPLAGGWLGLTGGAPDTVLVLIDRSASMEQQNLATGLSKREAGLKKLTDGIRDAYRGRAKLVLIDSAGFEDPQLVENPELLAELPATWATDTSADIPAMLQAGLDYITKNQTGRTDVWLLSDLQQGDWDASGGRWEPLRQGFAELPGVRFHLLAYPQAAPDNLAVTVARAARRESGGKAELVLDLEVSSTNPDEAEPNSELPLRFVINGVTSVHEAELKDGRLSLRGHVIPIDAGVKRGWGRVELPADSSPSDNAWHFVFDEPAALKSVIVTDDPIAMTPIRAALGAPLEPDRAYEAITLPPDRAAEIPWDETALIIWQAPLPEPDELIARQLQSHLAAGRSLLFLPPEIPGNGSFHGVSWGDWEDSTNGSPALVDWWRADDGLLANTRDGTALPVGEIGVLRRRAIAAENSDVVPLARMENNEPLLVRLAPTEEFDRASGEAWFLATLPGTSHSTLARDGVVLFALLHRARDAGSATLGNAQQRIAAPGVLGDASAASLWKRVEGDEETALPSSMLPLRAGVLRHGEGDDERLIALNRPLEEDQSARLPTTTVNELFAGLDHRIIEDVVEDERSLASEIWRTFLFLMAAALVLEALLSLPAKRPPRKADEKSASASRFPQTETPTSPRSAA
ncbi:MAG: BatA domain-containing protein [Verrucomicrobiae bacterium]|nr:BatA domain-containing protein [Verrucomicrobiae bacterium]